MKKLETNKMSRTKDLENEVIQEKYSYNESDYNCQSCNRSIYNLEHRIFSGISHKFLCEDCYHDEEHEYFLFYDRIISIACISLTQRLKESDLNYLAQKIVYQNEITEIITLDHAVRQIFTRTRASLRQDLELYGFVSISRVNFFDIASKICIFVLNFQSCIRTQNFAQQISDKLLLMIWGFNLHFTKEMKLYLLLLNEKMVYHSKYYDRPEFVTPGA